MMSALLLAGLTSACFLFAVKELNDTLLAPSGHDAFNRCAMRISSACRRRSAATRCASGKMKDLPGLHFRRLNLSFHRLNRGHEKVYKTHGSC